MLEFTNLKHTERFWQGVELHDSKNPEFHGYVLSAVGTFYSPPRTEIDSHLKIYTSSNGGKILAEVNRGNVVFACLALKTTKSELVFKNDLFGKKVSLSPFHEERLKVVNDWLEEFDVHEPSGMILALLTVYWNKKLPTPY